MSSNEPRLTPRALAEVWSRTAHESTLRGLDLVAITRAQMEQTSWALRRSERTIRETDVLIARMLSVLGFIDGEGFIEDK